VWLPRSRMIKVDSLGITGDVDLFSAPKDVVQTNQVYSIGLHYNVPVCCSLPMPKKYVSRMERTAA
jgi:hypothetical protein